MVTIYAGCANDRVAEVVDLSLAELRELRETPVPAEELRRAKDHLKGSLVLNLESTASRMSHLARQFIFFGRYFTLDEMTAAVEAVTADDVQRRGERTVSGRRAGGDGGRARRRVAVVRAVEGLAMIPRYTRPEMGAIWSDQRRFETWLEVELAATDALAEAGVVPAADARDAARARRRSTSRASRRSSRPRSTT